MFPALKHLLLLTTFLFLAVPVARLRADDWSQWLGNDRDSRWTETGIVDTLPKEPKVLWRVPIESGYAGPAVVGNRVFVTDYKKTKGVNQPDPGKRTELEGYCPPTLIKAGGVDQLIVWDSENLNSLDPATGNVYWSFPLKPAYEMSIIAPIQAGDYLLATALQQKSLLLKLDPEQPAATVVWKDRGVHPDHNPPIIVDGYLFDENRRRSRHRVWRAGWRHFHDSPEHSCV